MARDLDSQTHASEGGVHGPEESAPRSLWAELTERLMRRRVVTIILLALISGFAVVVYTAVFLFVAGVTPDEEPERAIELLFLASAAVAIVLLALTGWTISRFFIGLGRDRPGSRLSANLIVQFAIIAALPVGLGALFAGTLFLGIESWFSERTQRVLDNSRTVAESYLKEHQEQILSNVVSLAANLNNAKGLFDSDPRKFAEFLRVQTELQKLLGAYVVDSRNEVLAGALDPKVDTNINPLPPEAFEAAAQRPIVTPNVDQNQVVALIRLEAFEDAYLFASRRIDPRVPELISQTEEAFTQYRTAEESRQSLQWLYALTFLGMALLVFLVAILAALRSAKRIAEPLSRLALASDRVSRGDLRAQVDVGRGDDEVATLGRAFNRMTAELHAQRTELEETNRETDQRRRFIEAMMSGVTAGVIGLDAKGVVTLMNKSAEILLDVPEAALSGQNIKTALPDFEPLVAAAMASKERVIQSELDLQVDGHTRNLLVRITSEVSVAETMGYVVTFDDITELVSAQRMSAWADVARRIAHEIKNPLTPIQLSAERLRRKYTKEIQSQPEIFEQCTDTIIRQVSDIGRMVDEFSSFARMPEAVMKVEDFGDLVRQAAFLQRVGNPEVEFVIDLPDAPVMAECDGRQVSQALINLIKNAVEAVGTRVAEDGEGAQQGRISVAMTAAPGEHLEIVITDNGCGLPKDDRHRLTEPYMTTRTKGTGLGLAIVKKIMEDHGGALVLGDAPDHRGAMVRMVFPPERIVADAPAAQAGGQN